MAEGDIAAAVTDTFTFELGSIEHLDAPIRVGLDTYALAYREITVSRIRIVTVTISNLGIIGPVIQTFTVANANSCFNPRLIQVSGTVYAVAYETNAPALGGDISTVSISATGVIAAIAGPFTFDATQGTEPDFIPVSGTTFLLAYVGNGPPLSNGMFVKTITIPASGTPIGPVLTTLQIDSGASMGGPPDLALVSGSVFVVGYRKTGVAGILKTHTVTGGGAISAAIDTFTFDAVAAGLIEILNHSGTTFAVSYSGGAGFNDGTVKTVTIPFIGTPISGPLATMTYDAGAIADPHLLKPPSGSGNLFLVSYYDSGATDEVTLVSFTITAAGAISAVIDTLIVSSFASARSPVVFPLEDDPNNRLMGLGVGSDPAGLDGRLYTIDVDTGVAAGVASSPVAIQQRLILL